MNMFARLHATALTALVVAVAGVAVARGSLIASADVSQSGTEFTYTVFNSELPSSTNYVNIWTLNVNSPVSVLATPAGWDYYTDNATFVEWYNTDLALPYPNDIPPGGFLGGFEIGSTTTSTSVLPFSIGAWDHSTDSIGPSYQGSILAPSVISVPEPSTLSLVGSGVALLSGLALRRRDFK
jgi:hypothetical protein